MGQPDFTCHSRPIPNTYAHENVVDVLQDVALPLGYRWRAPLSWSHNPSPHVLSFY